MVVSGCWWLLGVFDSSRWFLVIFLVLSLVLDDFFRFMVVIGGC